MINKDGLVKVRCSLWIDDTCNTNIFLDCIVKLKPINRFDCPDSFYVDWVTYLINKKILVEVKDE